MKLFSSLALLSVLAPTAFSQTLAIGGFDDTRTFRPLSDAQTTFGYGGLVAELTDPSNFGPNGVMGCTIALASEAPLIDAAYLSTIDIFFTGVIDTTVSAAEAAAIATWQSNGGHVIVLADSASSSTAPANLILAALGSTATFDVVGCPNASSGATISTTGALANGPFGNIGGGTFAMSLARDILADTAMQQSVICTDGALTVGLYPPGTLGGANGGVVLAMSDTSWIDLFTLSSGALYNANNMPFALNAFAVMCGAPGGGFTLHCDPANANSSGNSVTLASSSTGGPTPLHLEATGGPPSNFGFFLVSFGFNEPGQTVSNGMLCLTTPIGRYSSAAGATHNSIGQFDGAGVLQNVVGTSTIGSGFDVPTQLPNPPGGMLQAGTTYYFQCWYRDGTRANFSNVLQFQ